MGNIASSLSDIAKKNCAVTYSFGNGREFPQNIEATRAPFAQPVAPEPRLGANLGTKLTQAFNNDLTDCVEVFTPFSAFGHLGNGQGLFRSARSLIQPYFGAEEPSPLMLKAILEGLQEFQAKISAECEEEFKECAFKRPG